MSSEQNPKNVSKPEGQLKKLLDKEMVFDTGGLTHFIIRDRVNDILGEAAKEFPTWEWARDEYLRRVKKTEVTSGLDMAGIDRVLAHERQTWFKKWFGACP
jgi:hypothetical protein